MLFRSLPAGRYMLTAYGRASSGTTTELFAEINTSAYSCVGDVGGEVWEMAEDDTPEKLCNGGKGRGWSIRSVELYVPEVGTVKFGVKSQTAGYQQWFSAGAFTLKAIGANENEGYDALYKSLKSANGIYDASFKNADILAEAIDQAGSLLGFTADSDEMIAMATELDKVADAYLFVNASAELPYNMTSYMVNPNAADKTNGWSLKGSAGASIGILSNQYFTGATVPYFDGGNWGATGWNVDFYQNVSELPSGKYIIKAAGRGNTSVDLSIYASSYLGELQANSELFNVCGDVGGEIWAEAAEGSAEKLCNGGNGRGWGYRTVEFPYLNGTDITIGFEASTEAHQQWMSAADFELFYIGKISTQEGQTAISSMLAAADKINSDKLFGDILINFTNAKASAEAALESDDIYQLESACKELNDAILEAQNMAEQFVVLKEQLDIAATYAETTYAGKEAFDAAVAKAQDIYDNLSADPQVAAAELAAAIS